MLHAPLDSRLRGNDGDLEAYNMLGVAVSNVILTLFRPCLFFTQYVHQLLKEKRLNTKMQFNSKAALLASNQSHHL